MSITYEVNEAIELESKTPASKVLKQCKEYERKNRRYFITVQISPSTKLLIDKRKHKNIDIKDLKRNTECYEVADRRRGNIYKMHCERVV